jgi:hypothetical protein
MNPPKYKEYDYINFLIATQKAYSCTEAEQVQPNAENAPTHDAITRLLHRMERDQSNYGVKQSSMSASIAAFWSWMTPRR